MMKSTLMKKAFSKNSMTLYLVVAVYAVVSTMLYTDNTSRKLTNMLISLSCYVVLAVSLNLVVGFLGELSLGHACFMSVGLFTGCIVSIFTRDVLPLIVRLPLSMLAGGLAAAIIGFLVGLPALRLKGDYLAIVTLACGEIVNNSINNLNIVNEKAGLNFKGSLGLNTNTAGIYSDTKTLFPYAIVLVLLTVIVMINIGDSKAGRNIMAIRDNRIAAESIGINITYYKLIVFIIAAFFAGMAGTLYGHGIASIKPATFNYNMSIEILVIVVLGGMGSVRGSVIAAIVLRSLPEVLREFSEYRMLLYSVLLIIIMILNENPKFAAFKQRLSFASLIGLITHRKNPKKEVR